MHHSVEIQVLGAVKELMWISSLKQSFWTESLQLWLLLNWNPGLQWMQNTSVVKTDSVCIGLTLTFWFLFPLWLEYLLLGSQSVLYLSLCCCFHSLYLKGSMTFTCLVHIFSLASYSSTDTYFLFYFLIL